MAGDQLPLFQRKTYKGIVPEIPLEIRAPSDSQTVLQMLPAYYTYLQSGGFSKYTPDDFIGDMKKFGIFTKGKLVKEITDSDIRSWISHLKTTVPKGEGLSAKTVSRKLSTLTNFYTWLITNDVIDEKTNPMQNISNARISSPLPEILFDSECDQLLTTASSDPRTYLCFFFYWKPVSSLRNCLP